VVFTGCSLLEHALRGQTPALPERGDGRRPPGENNRHSCACDHPRGDRRDGREDGAEQRFGDRTRYGPLSASRAWTNGAPTRSERQRQLVRVNRDVAEKMIQLENEKLAELVARYPDRFVAFASVALEFPDMGISSEKASRSTICEALPSADTSMAANFPLTRLIHSGKRRRSCLPGFHARAGHSRNEEAIGRQRRADQRDRQSAETTIILSHLIFDGTLDRFPGLKICSARCNRFPEGSMIKKDPTEYLR
jgi:hypothetical protein